ncbi:hypothetical protein CONPUDRAFT_161177 [Coniophora puteana RWD-64-598 SS2]|uniref:Uncharacterized protein n=1 Tax=Coniophora puteana (strain RWD-64-598) TaxID=741705 RepID=A0A5M3N5S1_CONPW|nr:uncharacterized protein CONPUDRAFT_161177 [Coniophora puteana RWD-64-598 SS2]EIW86424.1 hypothetical protein CONPUDRAFT_161177 [Coniophora puteana RWD-64-598 SS2]
MANIDKPLTEPPGGTNFDALTDTADKALSPPIITTDSSPPAVSSPDPASQSALALAIPSPTGSAEPSRPSSTTGVQTPTSSVSPHPKKFTAVNINKKFLQKNSSSSAPTHAPSSIATVKSGSPVPRPSATPLNLHSRLVTTKLTAAPSLSTTTGPGWSRPSSATPPASSTQSAAPNSTGQPHPPAPGPSTGPAPPQLPHAGKVIQPQRSSVPPKDSSKSAWSSTRPPVAPLSLIATSNDFPTAAEVAQGALKPKVIEVKQSEEPSSSKRVTMQEADAFRGVHLDPNAHHWDEMEEDDDNFLDEPINFGDGRHYEVSAPSPPDVYSAPTPGGYTSAPTPNIISAPTPNYASPPTPPHPFARTRTPDYPSARPRTPDHPGGHDWLDQRRRLNAGHPADSGLPHSAVNKEDRFADDYDRSWPRSKPSMSSLDTRSGGAPLSGSSHTSSQPSHSPSESSRHLFNERSNRLEPYSGQAPPPQRFNHGAGAHPPRLSSRPDDVEVSSDVHAGRDGQPHSARPVQLLQKSGGLPPRPPGPGHVPNRSSERAGPSSPVLSTGPPRGRERPAHLPSMQTGSSGSAVLSPISPGGKGRQLPPHLSQRPESPTRRRPSSTLESPPTSIRGAAASPVSSQTLEAPQLLSPAVDIEDVHKTAMHSAAERARQRRQIEEEERQKAQERAKRKAAEMEEKMKRLEADKALSVPVTEQKTSAEADAVNLIEEAVASADPRSDQQPILMKPSLSQRPTERQPSLRSISPSPSAAAAPSTAVETWRRGPPRVISPASQTPPPAPALPSQQQSLPKSPVPVKSVLHGAEPPPKLTGDGLEEVDFSDLGKFVSGEPPASAGLPPKPVAAAEAAKSNRPVASDFFESPPRTETNPWRRPPSEFARRRPSTSLSNSDRPSGEVDGPVPGTPSKPYLKEADLLATQRHPLPPVPVSPTLSMGSKAAAYREAPMSALDDVMSRIKGALDGMHAENTPVPTTAVKETPRTPEETRPPKPSPPPQAPLPLSLPPKPIAVREPRWLPPALRPRQPPGPRTTEVFDVTVSEPPRSPKPAWNAFTVNLPEVPELSFMPRKQIHLYKNASDFTRWDTLSWDPPVSGMSKRDLSVNGVLFKRPQPIRGKIRYRVSLPRFFPRQAASNSSTPRNVPATVGTPANAGIFGRPRITDDLTSWRKVAVSSEDKEDYVEAPSTPDVAPTSLAESASAKGDPASTPSRSKPKMPVGHSVGFYRDPESQGSEKTQTVNFTVSSELEEPTAIITVTPAPETSDLAALPESMAEDATELPREASKPLSNGAASDMDSPRAAGSSLVGSKSSDDSGAALVTPPSGQYGTPWKSPLSLPGKDSPARGPDPEHLKAVWSQTTDKALLPSVNSLKGIADDLTALPFTLQDVKSEDGGTPPPTSSAAQPRLSLSDVTRAFQQAPLPPSASSHRSAPRSPPSQPAPISRPNNFYNHNHNHNMPPSNPSMRPPYPPYSSQSLAHSPSPTFLYPPPGPNQGPPRMATNGHSPMYGQPLWVSVPSGPQNPNGGMRPMHSPYPAQLMYPSPNGVPMYGPPPSGHNGPNAAHPNGTSQPRRDGMPMISPVLPHAAPHAPAMYANSPVMMHAVPSGPQAFMSPVLSSGMPGRPDGAPSVQSQHPGPQNSHVGGYNAQMYSRPSW